MSSEGSLVSLDDAINFATMILIRCDVNYDFAAQTADVMAGCDYMGIQSSGLYLLEMFAQNIQKGIISPNNKPTIIQETCSTAWVNGNNGLGPVTANFCMNLAIKKAQSSGTAIVSCMGCNDFCSPRWYSYQALQHNMIGIAMSNSPPILCPPRAKEAALGINPISLAAPANKENNFVTDISFGAIPPHTLIEYSKTNVNLPFGCAKDSNGKNTIDPAVALMSSRLVPLGGTEMAEHKGYGMALFVEVLCGILSGSSFGPFIKTNDKDPLNLGHCFICLDIDCFEPFFQGRLEELINFAKGGEPVDPKKPVMAPGDLENWHMKGVDLAKGIFYSNQQIKVFNALSKEFHAPEIKLKKFPRV